MMFVISKSIHLVTIATTLALFLLRSLWAFQGSARLRAPLVRWLPHVNDTLLLASALTTAALLGQYPFVNGWLTAKVLALVAYIVLGHITLWRCRTNLQRSLGLAASLATFGYILMVARCHDPRAWVCFGMPA